MKIYCITDTHLGHTRLHEEWGKRPADFTDQLIKNLKGQSGDVLVHLGDLAITPDKTLVPQFMEATKGFKTRIFVKGNHDNKSDSWYYTQGFDFVCEQFMSLWYGKLILFSHAPIDRNWHNTVDFNIHGHLHGSAEESHRKVYGTYDESYHIDIAPENWGYKALDLEAIIKSKETC